MKWIVILLILLPIVHAKVLVAYPLPFDKPDYRERLLLPHIYPGQTIVSNSRFLADPLRPGTSTVKWTSEGAFSIKVDRIHLLRKSYTVIIRSRFGPDVRQLPFETTKIYLRPDYYKISFDKHANTVWLARYAD